MKCLFSSFLLTLAMLGMGAATAVAQKKVTFTPRAVPAGTVLTIAKDLHTTMNQSFVMGETRQQRSKDTTSKYITVVTVLEATQKGITKARVHFKLRQVRKKSSTPMGDQEESEESPLAGRTLIIEATSGAVKVTDKEGNEADDTLVKAIKEEYGNELKAGIVLNPCRELNTLIGAREMEVGETLKLNGGDTRRLLRISDKKSDLGAMSMKLKGTKKVFGVDCAVFDITLTLSPGKKAAASLEIKSDIKGELTLRLDGMWTQSISLKGPLNAEGSNETPHGVAHFSVSGEVDISSLTVIQVPR